MIYLSKRATPLIEADAISILDVTMDEYRSALAEGQLRRSIQIDNDPTGRLAFHSFWDLLEFSLAQSEDVASESSEARRLLAAELSDDLAGTDNDVAVGTGNPHEDFALIADEWTDETDVSVLPESVVSCYARLLLRTLRHIYSVAESTLLGHEGLLRSCQEQAAATPGQLEPLMEQAAA